MLGVALGALASYLVSSAGERTRWRRAQATRWDDKRNAAYAQFAHLLKQTLRASLWVAAGQRSVLPRTDLGDRRHRSRVGKDRIGAQRRLGGRSPTWRYRDNPRWPSVHAGGASARAGSSRAPGQCRELDSTTVESGGSASSLSRRRPKRPRRVPARLLWTSCGPGTRPRSRAFMTRAGRFTSPVNPRLTAGRDVDRRTGRATV